MTAPAGGSVIAPADIGERRLGWTPRRRVAVFTAAAVAWAVSQAGLGDEIVNVDGWSSFADFWTAILDPDLSAQFLRLTADAAVTTVAYAVLGTALSLVLGVLGALATAELLVGTGAPGRLARAVLVVPRSVHEVIWALLLIQVLGFDPLVAVLAIGIPFGAVTAKVFAETIDEAEPNPYHRLRSSGAGKLTALAYGVVPSVSGELVSYSFYRLECAIRSAAVLGVVGAGGLGFQLDLSFESLRYNEIWTLIAALMVLSGTADWWSSTVRHTRRDAARRSSVVVAMALVPLSWIAVDVTFSSLWSPRTRRRFGDLLADLFPPRLGPGGWSELIDASRDTVAMSLIALALAAVGGLALGAASARPTARTRRPSRPGTASRLVGRLALLLFRAVPAPIWAFLFVLVLYPGLWPGAVALGVYNLGVLGRLYSESFEERDPAATDALVVRGASPTETFCYATLPATAPRLVSLTLYRWEVITRETVVVGVVGAGGLGQLINEDLAARDFAAVSSAVIALIVICLAIDALSAAIRRRLR